MDEGTLRDLVALRRDLHAHPELGFEEHRTAAIVAERLEAAGWEVRRGLGRTGVVGTLRAGRGPRAVGLRADMDALALPETGLPQMGTPPWASTAPGRMHACGHDGHTAMLLGAAEALGRAPGFEGTVHAIFQPAEEGRGGARAMVEDGLLDLCPMDMAFGLHNLPGLPVGAIAAVEGPQLASSDSWEVTFAGRGTHGAKPHLGHDAVTAMGHFLAQLAAVTAREVDPLEPAVVSACAVAAGDFRALNVIPGAARVGGTARAFTPAVRDRLEEAIGRLARGVAAGFGVEAAYDFRRRIPPVVNAPGPVAVAQAAAERALGPGRVRRAWPPSTAGDDFAELSTRMPACFAWIGNGPLRDGAGHHNGGYDFADAAIPAGVAWWCEVARGALRAEP